jgi:hypothetical protein
MGSNVAGQVAELLLRWSGGERECLNELALVNEAWLKQVDQSRANWQNRVLFLGVAAGLMCHILVDRARATCRGKRGGGAAHLLVAFDDVLNDFARVDPRKARVVELRYFGGLSVEETAEALNVHPNTVIRDWGLARVWPKHELTRGKFAHAG